MASCTLWEELSQAVKLGAVVSHVHAFFMSFFTTQSLARVRRHALTRLLVGETGAAVNQPKEIRGFIWLRQGARRLLEGGEPRETWLPVHTLPSFSSSLARQDVPLDSHGRSPQCRPAAAATPTHQRCHLHKPEQRRGLLLLQGKHFTFL